MDGMRNYTGQRGALPLTRIGSLLHLALNTDLSEKRKGTLPTVAWARADSAVVNITGKENYLFPEMVFDSNDSNALAAYEELNEGVVTPGFSIEVPVWGEKKRGITVICLLSDPRSINIAWGDIEETRRHEQIHAITPEVGTTLQDYALAEIIAYAGMYAIDALLHKPITLKHDELYTVLKAIGCQVTEASTHQIVQLVTDESRKLHDNAKLVRYLMCRDLRVKPLIRKLGILSDGGIKVRVTNRESVGAREELKEIAVHKPIVHIKSRESISPIRRMALNPQIAPILTRVEKLLRRR